MLALILASALAIENPYPKHVQYIFTHEAESFAIASVSNAVIGCLIGGAGSKFNDGNFGYGCVGGVVGNLTWFVGANLYKLNATVPGSGAVAKLSTDLGSSILANASNNMWLLDRYMTDIGPISFKFEKGKPIEIGFLLFTTYNIAYSIIKHRKFDTKTSLQFITPVFKADINDIGNAINSGGLRLDYIAFASGNSIVYLDELRGNLFNSVITHEMVHVSQHSRYKFGNDVFNLPYLNVGQESLDVLTSVPGLFERAYFYSPIELEAYMLEGRY